MSWLSKKLKQAKKKLKKVTIKNVCGKVAGAIKDGLKLPVLGDVLNIASGGIAGTAAKALADMQSGINKSKKIVPKNIKQIAGGIATNDTSKVDNKSNLSFAIGSSAVNPANNNNPIGTKRSLFSFLGTTKKRRRNG